jgi:hypothetical protein
MARMKFRHLGRKLGQPALLSACAACWTGVACKQAAPDAAPPAASSVVSDRLAPGEVLPGRGEAFGMEVPKGMQISSKFGTVIHLTGNRSVQELVDHFRERVVVSSIELTSERATFARAYVRTDTSKRLYSIDIARAGKRTTVKLSDITPTPAAHGLSEAERLERAGFNTDGSLKDRLKAF